jgi:hypothetical protein
MNTPRAIENHLLGVLELAAAAFAEGAAPELRRSAALALRSTADMLETDRSAAGAGPAPAAGAAAAKKNPPPASTTPPPDFLSALLERLMPLLPPDALTPEVIAKAQTEAREEGFRLPIGVDLSRFINLPTRH